MLAISVFTCLITFAPNNAKASGLQYVSNNGWWSSGTNEFDANKVTGRVISGDFNGDGKADVASFYDMGNETTRLFVWLSNGSSFTHTDSFDWQSGTGSFDTNRIKGVVSGDFDGDGRTDIGVFYDIGSSTTRMYIFKSTGSSFEHIDSFDWQSGAGSFNPNNIVGVVSGNFTGSLYTDVAVFYNCGNSTSKIFVFKSTGSSFVHADTCDWTSGNGGFDPSKVKGIIAGNFQGKDKPAGVSVFYDLGNSTTKIFTFMPYGGRLTHIDSFDWQSEANSFNANNIKGRVVAGNFTGSNIDDIAMFYDCGNTSTKLMVFKSNGSSFTHDQNYDWQTGNTYNANMLTNRVVAGDFNGDKAADIAGYYDSGNATTEIHVWLTTGGVATSSDAQKLINVARAELGKTDGTKYSDGRVGAWCADFVSWCALQAGVNSTKTVIYSSPSCQTMATWFKNNGAWQNGYSGYTPKPGDIIFFSWTNNYTYDHVGIVEYVDVFGVIHTIEGNYSNSVAKNTYAPRSDGTFVGTVSGTILGYGTPKYTN